MTAGRVLNPKCQAHFEKKCRLLYAAVCMCVCMCVCSQSATLTAGTVRKSRHPVFLVTSAIISQVWQSEDDFLKFLNGHIHMLFVGLRYDL